MKMSVSLDCDFVLVAPMRKYNNNNNKNEMFISKSIILPYREAIPKFLELGSKTVLPI